MHIDPPLLRSSLLFIVVGPLVLAPAADAKGSLAVTQARAKRVKAARKASLPTIQARFHDAGVRYPARELLIRVFKEEGELELWAGDTRHAPLTLVHTFSVCASSGTLGPKRQQGDLQVPEGFYRIDRFNAWSSYHLSLGVNYPNRSDRLLGKRPLGGDIFIHGDCVTIGCIPIEDGPVEELYLAALDSQLRTGRAPHVHIFPRRLHDAGFAALLTSAPNDELRAFWTNLREVYLAFERAHVVPKITVDAQGRYVVRPRSTAR